MADRNNDLRQMQSPSRKTSWQPVNSEPIVKGTPILSHNKRKRVVGQDKVDADVSTNYDDRSYGSDGPVLTDISSERRKRQATVQSVPESDSDSDYNSARDEARSGTIVVQSPTPKPMAAPARPDYPDYRTFNGRKNIVEEMISALREKQRRIEEDMEMEVTTKSSLQEKRDKDRDALNKSEDALNKSSERVAKAEAELKISRRELDKWMVMIEA